MCKKYGYEYKKKNAYAYEIFPLAALFYIAFNQTCVITHAYFLRLAKNKIRTRYAYFSDIYKKVVCGVTSQGCLV